MTMYATHLYDPTTTTDEHGGAGAATEVYRIWDDSGAGVTLAQTYSPVTLQWLGVPLKGTSHPHIPGAIVLRHDRRQEGRTVLLTAIYGPPSGSSRPPVDLLSADFLTLETSYGSKEVKLPGFRVHKIEPPGETPGSVETMYAWGEMDRDFTLEVDYAVFTAVLGGEFTAGLTVPQFIQANAAVEDQTNRLHLLNGRYYRFRPRFVKQRTESTPDEPAKWECQYTWESDPGVPNTLFGRPGWVMASPGSPAAGLILRSTLVGQPPVPLFTHAYIAQDEQYALRPFTRVDTFPNLDDPESPPSVQFTDLYAKDDNGWQTLPGIA